MILIKQTVSQNICNKVWSMCLMSIDEKIWDRVKKNTKFKVWIRMAEINIQVNSKLEGKRLWKI